MGAGVIMAFVIIDPMARAMIFTTIALGIVRALDIPLKNRESTALGLAAFFAMSGPGLMLYTSGNEIYINSVYRNVAGNIDYFQWLLGNILPSLAWMLISVLIVLKFFRLDNKPLPGCPRKSDSPEGCPGTHEPAGVNDPSHPFNLGRRLLRFYFWSLCLTGTCSAFLSRRPVRCGCPGGR